MVEVLGPGSKLGACFGKTSPRQPIQALLLLWGARTASSSIFLFAPLHVLPCSLRAPSKSAMFLSDLVSHICKFRVLIQHIYQHIQIYICLRYKYHCVLQYVKVLCLSLAFLKWTTYFNFKHFTRRTSLSGRILGRGDRCQG